MSSEARTIEGDRQRLGRRLGHEPYYTVAERSASLLRLESRPEANRATGLRVLAGAAAMLAVAAVVAVSGLVSAASGAGFAVAALAAVIAAIFGGLGYQRAVGGYAVLTTRNTIVCDREAASVTFRQGSKVGPERIQILPFARVSELRLRRRPLASGWPVSRVRPIIALELRVGEQVWVVDTAADAEALRPTAEGLSEVLGREFAQA
jgi:hypothetical protein